MSFEVLVIVLLLVLLFSFEENVHILEKFYHDSIYFRVEFLVHISEKLLVGDFPWSLDDIVYALLQD